MIKNDINNLKNDSIFFNSNNEIKYDKIIDIFCGEEILTFVSGKGNLFIYNEIQGLFKVKINQNNYNYSSILNEQKLDYYINSVKFIDRNFYAISKNNSIVYEFINYTYKNKLLNLFDYVQNEYEVNDKIQLSLINQPYYIKILFFQMKCFDNQFYEFMDYQDSIFKKRKYNYSNNNNYIINSSNNNNNELLNNNYNNNIHETTNSINSNPNLTSMSRVSKISSMLGNIFEKKIENIKNNTKILQNNEGNIYLLGKKRIQLIRVDYINSEGINLLMNETMNDIYLDSNGFNMSNNILNIPINENYYNEKYKRNQNNFEERNNQNSNKINLHYASDNESNYGKKNNNKKFNLNNSNNESSKFRVFSTGHNNNLNDNGNKILFYNNDEKEENLKERII